MTQAASRITDDDVRTEARLFGQQEGVHAAAHQKHARALVARYPGLQSILDRAQASYDEQLETHSLPTEGGRTEGGASILRLQEAAAQPVLNIFRGLPTDALTSSQVEVSVMNGSGIEGQARQVAEALELVGFDVGETGNAEIDVVGTEIHHAPGAVAEADLLARHLTAGAVLVEDTELDPEDGLVLITGADFATIMETPRASSPSTTVPGAAPAAPAEGGDGGSADGGDPAPPAQLDVVLSAGPGSTDDETILFDASETLIVTALVTDAAARRTSGTAASAPLPSPRRRSRSRSGCLPSRASSNPWPGSGERWADRQWSSAPAATSSSGATAAVAT